MIDFFCNLTELASFFNLTGRAIQYWGLKPTENGKYSIREAIQKKQEIHDREKFSLEQSRAELARAQTISTNEGTKNKKFDLKLRKKDLVLKDREIEKSELLLAKEKKTLVSVDEFLPEYEKKILSARARLLSIIPMMPDPFQDDVQQIIYQALEDLARREEN